jgi:hypothetical protein
MDSTSNEVLGCLYVAMTIAAGGRELLDSSNNILREAIETGAISRPDTRRAISALIAATARAA